MALSQNPKAVKGIEDNPGLTSEYSARSEPLNPPLRATLSRLQSHCEYFKLIR
jgi:hypothetical protein